MSLSILSERVIFHTLCSVSAAPEACMISTNVIPHSLPSPPYLAQPLHWCGGRDEGHICNCKRYNAHRFYCECIVKVCGKLAILKSLPNPRKFKAVQFHFSEVFTDRIGYPSHGEYGGEERVTWYKPEGWGTGVATWALAFAVQAIELITGTVSHR